MVKMNDILPLLCRNIAEILKKVDSNLKPFIEEIRLRAEKPLMISNYKSDWFVRDDGLISRSPKDSYIVKQSEINITLEIMSQNSIYAYQEEIKQGYLTVKGGHRVGITGKVVSDGENVRNIRDISGMNIRISKQIIGCADEIIRFIAERPDVVRNTLIISPPQCGKTTILRDIARYLSDGIPDIGFKGVKVGIVDERSEIAACYKGIPQNNVGLRTDVLDGCPKKVGMSMLVRSMSPHVVITDEIGNDGDRDAIMSVLNAGVKVIATAHGYNISEMRSRREVLRLIEEKVFERFIVLSNQNGPGTIVEIIDGETMQALKIPQRIIA